MTAVKQQYVPAPLLEEEEIRAEIKPLSKNKFVRFFQKIGRGWLGVWNNFADKYPKLSKVIYMAFFFIIFSQAVTILQFLIFNFGTAALPASLAANDWAWPRVFMGLRHESVCALADGVLRCACTGAETCNVYWRILGASPRFHNGVLVTGIGAGGLAYFIMFMIGTFVAQVVNFPLQRNITFRSKGNPAWQAMWYFIGWMLIQPLTMMLGSAWEGAVAVHLGGWPGVVITLLNTVIMGGVSMAIFFVIFLIIFPDRNKAAKRAKVKLDAAVAKGVDGERLAKLERKYEDAQMRADVSNADKRNHKGKGQASVKAISYFATVNALDRAEKELARIEGVYAGLELYERKSEEEAPPRYIKSEARKKRKSLKKGKTLANAQLLVATLKKRVPLKHQAVSDAKRERIEAAAHYEETNERFAAYKEKYGLKK